MESTGDLSTVTRQFLHSVIEIIGRKSSPDYAIVMVDNTVKKLQSSHEFLQFVDIKNTQYSETGDMITIRSSLDSIEPKQVGKAMQDLVMTITTAMGASAGFFFIKELKDRIGTSHEIILKSMGIDLGLLQYNYEINQKQNELQRINNVEIMKRVLKATIDVIEEQTSRTVAITTLAQCLEQVRVRYDFLSHITLHDIRLTLGSEEISINPDFNNVDPQELGKAIDRYLNDIRTALGEKDLALFLDELRKHLTIDIVTKLEEIGIKFPSRQSLGHEVIIQQVLKAIVDVLGKASTPAFAVYAVNTLLRKIEGKYDFLKSITVSMLPNNEAVYEITIQTNLDEISEPYIRRAIQKLLEEIIASLGEDLRRYFIEEFKNTLDNNSLVRMEKMGINLHIIQMRQELLGKQPS